MQNFKLNSKLLEVSNKEYSSFTFQNKYFNQKYSSLYYNKTSKKILLSQLKFHAFKPEFLTSLQVQTYMLFALGHCTVVHYWVTYYFLWWLYNWISFVSPEHEIFDAYESGRILVWEFKSVTFLPSLQNNLFLEEIVLLLNWIRLNAFMQYHMNQKHFFSFVWFFWQNGNEVIVHCAVH